MEFVGAFNVDSPPSRVAADMSEALGLDRGWAAVEGSWTNALSTLRNHIEAAGVLVYFNGIVGNDTHRKLDPDEFQGFALVDKYAPLIFINNADYKTAQIFTLAHELAHILVGEAGVSKFENLQSSDHKTEKVCNQMAAEFLVPEGELLRLWSTVNIAEDPYQDVARHFKVSTVVAARRALDSHLISEETFWQYYRENRTKDWGGAQQNDVTPRGNFWSNQRWRVGLPLASAVSRAVKEGRLSYREAHKLTGLKGATFDNMATKMGLGL